MSTTAEPDTSDSDDFDEDPPAEPAGSSDILLGAGQSMWLGLITVGTILALVLSIVAIVMSRSEGESGNGGGEAAGPSSSLTVSAIDIAFEPDSWTVTADAEADVTLNNDGALEHNWTALELGVSITTEDEFDAGTVVAATSDIAGGESDTVSATFAPGTYQVICTIAGHLSAGMTGTLTAA